jgi:hypothetical protein
MSDQLLTFDNSHREIIIRAIEGKNNRQQHCMEMRKDFTPNFGGKTTGCCITTTDSFTLPFS